jgi:hypothetical protein
LADEEWLASPFPVSTPMRRDCEKISLGVLAGEIFALDSNNHLKQMFHLTVSSICLNVCSWFGIKKAR